MAVVKRQSFDTWIGTAAERGTFTLAAVGDDFFESDTGLTYRFCGGTTWTKVVYPAPAE